MSIYTDKATRTLKLQKAEKPKIGNGLPPSMDGFEGENRIQMVEGKPRLYYRTNNAWYFTGLSQDGTTPDIPTATSTRLGLIKIGSGGTVSSDGTYTATAATPAADDITGGDAAVTISTSSGNITIDAAANNSDVIFKGTDNTSDITMLTLDGSEAGNAIFNANVTVGALLIMPDVTNNKILVSDGTSYQEVALSGDATIANTGAITLAAAQTNITSIYATDLIIGEDSQTAIDFGTANEIDFKINNATELTLDASALYPVTDAGLDLGTSTLEFKDAFFDGTVTSDAFAGPLTGDVTGNVSGNAGTVTVATRSTDADHYILFSSATSGSLSVYDNASFKVNPSTGVLTVPNMTISTTLTVEGLTATDNIDIGNVGFRAAELYADNRTSGRVAFYAANGQLQDDSDLTFATATLTATAFSGPLTGNVTGNLSGTVLTATQGTINHDSLANFVTNEHINWVNASAGTIHASNYTDTVDMGDGFKIADADSNHDVTEGHYVKFITQQGTAGTGVITGAGSSGNPWVITLNAPDTNTVDMGDGFVLEDGDGTELAITENKEVKFIESTGIDIDWTDTSHGTDGDPYDLTFTLTGNLPTLSGLANNDGNFIVANGTAFTVESGATARTSLGLGSAAVRADSYFASADHNQNLASAVTGTLAVGNGGTGATSLTSNKVLTGNGTSAITAEGNLEFDGDDLTLSNAGSPIIRTKDTTNDAIAYMQAGDSVGVIGTESNHTLYIRTNDTTRITIDTSGNTQITGNVRGEADVIAYYSSDPSLKENKELINNPLDKISKIGGYSFDWKDEAKNKVGDHLVGKDYGVMADEIQSLFPELVSTRSNGIRAVKYDKLVPLLIEGIKELKQQLDTIK